MSTIKVLHVIARLNVGGTAKYIGDLVQNIPESALAIGYVQGAEIEDPVVNSIKVYRVDHLGRKISFIQDIKAFIELRKLVRELKPQVVHTHTFKAGLLGRLISGDHKRVHTFHGHLFHDSAFSRAERRIITFVEKFLARRTDVLISVGERVGLELREAGIGLSKKWVSISPGVRKLPLISKADARSLLDLDPDLFYVGWMARMTGVKNPLLLLEISEQMPTVNFVMAGGGDLIESIKSKAPRNVQVIGWTNASIFWSAVDIAISTSENEGMPIALIEAQLSGVPVVATNVGSSSEVVTDGVSGFVTNRSVDALMTALDELISNPDLRANMSDAAVRLSMEKFDLHRMLEAHVDIYADVVSRKI